jgi:hypothetical protein
VRNRIAAGSIIGIVILISLAALRPDPAAAGPPPDASVQGLSLITDTPEEGFALAIALSRKGVKATQPDTEVLHALRPGYAQDAESLIAASHVIAVHFQTVAAANGYWRE